MEAPDPKVVEAAFERLTKTRPQLAAAAVTPWAWVLGGDDEDEQIRAYGRERCGNQVRAAEDAGWVWNASRSKFVRPLRGRLPFVAAWAAAVLVVVGAVVAAVVGGAVAAGATAGLGSVALLAPAVLWIERRRRTS